MLARSDNPGSLPPGLDAYAGNGHARNGGDARALGTSLPSERPMPGNHFVNGAQQHFDGQNSSGDMPRAENPYVSSDDRLLATQLNNVFPMLGDFKKNGRLTLASLEDIAKEEPGESKVSEPTIMLAREILNRPRLSDAIIAKGAEITPISLDRAASLSIGNTNPNTQSADPYHAKTDAQVVEAFRGMFDDLRDKSKDSTFFFERHRYVNKDTIIEMSKDPDETSNQGEPVLDFADGFPKKKYSEQQVFMAKNLVERPGLLASLGSTKANGTNIFGSHNADGWLKNYSIDRWLKNDKEEKGR